MSAPSTLVLSQCDAIALPSSQIDFVWSLLRRHCVGAGKRPVKLGRVEPTRKWRLETADAVAGERADTIPPAEQSVETSAAPQEAVLPAGQQGTLVSMTELQTVLQGLEERLMQRLTPPAQVQ